MLSSFFFSRQKEEKKQAEKKGKYLWESNKGVLQGSVIRDMV